MILTITYIDTRDTYGPANPHITDPGRNQYNPSGMGRSSGMGSNTYGSGPGSGNEMGTYHDSELDGWFPETGSSLFMLIIDTLTGHVDTRNTGGSINAGPHDSKLANKKDPRVDSELGKLNRSCYREPVGFLDTIRHLTSHIVLINYLSPVCHITYPAIHAHSYTRD